MEGTCTARLLLHLFVLAFVFETASGLLIRRVRVPSSVVVGEEFWLECDFLEQGESVYTLKWYLGLDEFYRWTPAETPSVKSFSISGSPLLVDKAASDRGRVKVLGATLEATGVLRCEVSAEAPSFHTEFEVATIVVIDLPDERPVITGVRAVYQVHDDVGVNCTSPRSQPPATLAFYINDQPAEPSWLRPYVVKKEGESGLETASLGMVFPLMPKILSQGTVQVKCAAAILDKYWESSVVSVHTDLPHQASIVEERMAMANGSASVVLSTGGVQILLAWAVLWCGVAVVRLWYFTHENSVILTLRAVG